MTIERSATTLKVRIIPWVIWIVGGIAVMVGFVPMLLLGSSRLQCDRTPPPGRCTLTKSNLVYTSEQPFPLAALTGASLSRSRTREGRWLYQVQLETSEGKLALTDYYSNGEANMRSHIRQIEAFLSDSSQTRLVVEEETTWFVLLFVVVFSGVGIGLVITCGAPVTLEFDKARNHFTLTRHRLFSQEHLDRSLLEVKGIRIRSNPSADRKKSPTYFLEVALTNGEVIPLANYATNNLAAHQHLREQVADFLGKSGPAELPGAEPLNSAQDPMQGFAVPPGADVLFLMLRGKAAREKAITQCRDQLQQDPTDMDAHARLAILLAMNNDQPAGEAHLRQARQQFTAAGDQMRANQITALLQHLQW